MNAKKKLKTGARIAIGLATFLLVLGGVFLIYVSDYSHADEAAVAAAISATDVHISNTDGALVFDPGNADTALIFYPGGKVEYTAYEPLMIQIARQGILCILPEMPFNLAVFDINAADAYLPQYPGISHWYVGGHSLGGSMAASYAAKNSEKLEGLILLASYSASDISQSELNVLSIFGSKDGVLNMDSYRSSRSNLPADFSELILSGGNHAGFGNYGPQKGDGTAEITPEQQQAETAEAVAEFCLTQ